MGFVRVSDTNAPDSPADALVTFDSTVNEKNQRVSTFDAFLPREIASKRKRNLTVCPNTIVARIVFSQSTGKKPRAEQVLFKSVDPKDRKTFSVKVKREAIVCSGSIGSPQVLMMRYVLLRSVFVFKLNTHYFWRIVVLDLVNTSRHMEFRLFMIYQA